MDKGVFGGTEKSRANKLELLYERNLEDLFGIPQIGLTVLNQILGEFFSTGLIPRQNLVLLKIKTSFLVRPQKRTYAPGRALYEYSVRFLKKLYIVYFGKKGGAKLLEMKLDTRIIKFSWEGSFRREKKYYSLPEVQRCADLTASKFKNATGMGVKRVSSNGIFRLGSHFIRVGCRYKGTFILVFFDRSKVLVFGLNGHRIKVRNIK